MGESDVRPLWDELKLIRDGQVALNTELSAHRKASNLHSEKLSAEIGLIKDAVDKAIADTKEIYESLPEDEHGRKSPFVHKTHHVIVESGVQERRRASDEGRELKNTLLHSIIDASGKILVGATILLVLGEKAVKLLGGM